TDPLVEAVSIPYEHTEMPGYLVRARGREHETRPLLIGTNGYDATVTEMYFAFAAAAADRGYHCLFFDGPGQGKLLIDGGVPMRSDWERVVTPVVDFALGLDGVDHDRIALTGWSLGGDLPAPRASARPPLVGALAAPRCHGL